MPALLAGLGKVLPMMTGFFGKGDGITAIVRFGRFAYVSQLLVILVAWYTSWRNQRVAPGAKTKWPVPGIDKSDAVYSPSRSDPDLSQYSSGDDLIPEAIGSLGQLPAPGTTGPIKIPGGIGNQRTTLIALGNLAKNRFKLSVGEHPAFGGVTGGHSANSWHNKGRAIDVSGDSQKMRLFAAYVRAHFGKHVIELIHQNPQGSFSMANGKDVAPSYWGTDTWNDHKDHVHLAM